MNVHAIIHRDNTALHRTHDWGPCTSARSGPGGAVGTYANRDYHTVVVIKPSGEHAIARVPHGAAAQSALAPNSLYSIHDTARRQISGAARMQRWGNHTRSGTTKAGHFAEYASPEFQTRLEYDHDGAYSIHRIPRTARVAVR